MASRQTTASIEAARTAGFAPVSRSDARILVLGSLPGRRSVAEQQYYAHPRNAFWPILKELLAIDGDYRRRCRQLLDNRIALWDVLQSSVRPGSLDADINLDAARANDFAAFFESHRDIRLVLYNGKKAASLFARFVEARPMRKTAEFRTLPSTSPAYAALSFSGKLSAWREALRLDADIPTDGRKS